MRYRPEKPLHVNPYIFCRTKARNYFQEGHDICSELFSNHTHKRASVMPKPQSFTLNTDENSDILKNFTGVVFR